jgi:hypothetical protein
VGDVAQPGRRDQRLAQGLSDVVAVGEGLHQPSREERRRRHRTGDPADGFARRTGGDGVPKVTGGSPPAGDERLRGLGRRCGRRAVHRAEVVEETGELDRERLGIGRSHPAELLAVREVAHLVAHGPTRRRRRGVPGTGTETGEEVAQGELLDPQILAELGQIRRHATSMAR